MAMRIPPEVALSICEKIREENRGKPSDPQARQCRNCEACAAGAVIKSQAGGAVAKAQAGGRPCCLVRQRCARLLAMAV